MTNGGKQAQRGRAGDAGWEEPWRIGGVRVVL